MKKMLKQKAFNLYIIIKEKNRIGPFTGVRSRLLLGGKK
jgi:hypothetical protein